jgi:hypothetical protein
MQLLLPETSQIEHEGLMQQLCIIFYMKSLLHHLRMKA